MAARTEQEILNSFKESAKLSDETLDVDKGPMYSLLGRPLATVLAPVEAEVARLEQIYSSEFAKVATEGEAQAFLTNWGEVAGEGTPSTVRVFFMTFNRPRVDQIIDIPIGSLVGNFDQTLQYITVEAGQIRGDLVDSYYNPQRRTYEVGLQCVAVAVGVQYELPSGRIIQKVSPIVGIDAVENREKCTAGAEAETLVQQIERVQRKFTGLAVNTGTGSYSRISRYAPTSVLDVKTIIPTNRKLFRRLVYGPAKDYYILGTLPKTVVETYVALGGESEILITNLPAIAINSVSINNVPLSNFTLRKDTSPQIGYSAKAKDYLVLGFSLLAGDVVTFSVTYNSLIQDIQKNVLSEEQVFNTDELAREFVKMPIRVEITGRTLASYDPVTIENEIKAQLESLITQNKWVESFYPNLFIEDIKRNVAGLTNLQLIKFQRTSLATGAVEIVTLQQNEIAVYDSDYVTVQIRNV